MTPLNGPHARRVFRCPATPPPWPPGFRAALASAYPLVNPDALLHDFLADHAGVIFVHASAFWQHVARRAEQCQTLREAAQTFRALEGCS